MGVPYERTLTIEVDNAAICYAVDFPSHVNLTKIRALQVGEGAKTNFTLDVYSRAFAETAVVLIQAEAYSAVTLLTCATKHMLQAGDTITVAGNAQGAMNTSHVVTDVVDPYRVLTDQASPAATGLGGTVTLAIPSTQWAAYEVIAQQTASSGVLRWESTPGIPFVNQDAIRDHGRNRMIYLKFSGTHTYLITLGSLTDWAKP